MRLLLGLAVALSLAACDTDSSGLLDPQDVRVSDLSSDPAMLVGTWELATVTPSGECMGEDCTRTRPASETGWSERVVFGEDGTARVTRNGEPEDAVAYRVDREGGEAWLTIGTRRELFGVAGDQLFTDSRYVDGPLLEYRRR